jgi:hypothetical protein
MLKWWKVMKKLKGGPTIHPLYKPLHYGQRPPHGSSHDPWSPPILDLGGRGARWGHCQATRWLPTQHRHPLSPATGNQCPTSRPWLGERPLVTGPPQKVPKNFLAPSLGHPTWFLLWAWAPNFASSGSSPTRPT